MMPNNPAGMIPQIMQTVQQVKMNPLGFLAQRGFNLPQNVGADPNAILHHLVSTGQVSQQQINNAYQFIGQFKR